MKSTFKYCYLIAFIVLLPQLIVAKSDIRKEIAKFVITNASKNGTDLTPYYQESGAYLIFYTSGNDRLINMANVFPKLNSQSYGPIYAGKSSLIAETAIKYKVDILFFKWHFINSYNEKTGIDNVEVTKIYKPFGIAFTIKIIPENLDILIYNGYMDGSVDFSAFKLQ